MKKLLLIAMCIALAAVAVACTATASITPPATSPEEPATTPSSDVTNQPATPPASGLVPDEEPPVVTQGEEDNRLVVADAMMYRGTVTKVVKDVTGADGTKYSLVVTLEQAPGTDYGAPSLQFGFDENTRISFDEALLTTLEGRYLEVFYRYITRNMPDPDTIYNAIAINDYESADMVNFNGVVEEIIPHPTKEGEGRYLMASLDNPEFKIYYLYSADTKFNMNQEDIKVGDKLNILHSPATAMSMPPQTFSYEIQLYREARVAG